MPHPREPRADMTWSPSGEVLTVETLDGAHSWKLYDPGGRIARRLRAGRPYEFKLLERIRDELPVRPGGVAIDVGAHVGNHTLFLAVACGLKVHAFEPLLYNLQRLRGNLNLNGVGPDRVIVWPYAAGAVDNSSADWRGGRYLSLDPTLPGDVRVRTVDACLPNVEDVRVVKIDVEGFEPHALAGMKKLLTRCEPIVWTEIHTEEAHAAQRNVLADVGYEFDGYVNLGSRMGRWKMGRWKT